MIATDCSATVFAAERPCLRAMRRLAFALLCCVMLPSSTTATNRSFVVANDRLIRDGEPIQIISGSVYFTRIPKPFWHDRLQRIKSMGLNTIETYVVWQYHERVRGKFTFSGRANLTEFVLLAQELGLMVQLRLGPYMAGEWDYGGFPAWLSKNEYRPKWNYMQLRSDDKHYLVHVEAWYNKLLGEVVRPLLWENGGPIIMVQMENEYSYCVESYSFERGQVYLKELLRMVRQNLGPNVVVYTTDPPNTIDRGGTLPGPDVLSAVDFGPGWYALEEAFGAQLRWNPKGMSPPLCTELYTGWLASWGDKLYNVSVDPLIADIKGILRYANNSGSLSLYVVHGGSNFGAAAGAAFGNTLYKPFQTSYDFTGAPIGEGGRTGQPGIGGPNKFQLIRTAISEHLKQELPPPLPEPLWQGYGEVDMSNAEGGGSVAVMDVLAALSSLPGGLDVDEPSFMEDYGQASGLIAYSTNVSAANLMSGAQLMVKVADYAKVFLGKEMVASTNRSLSPAVNLPPYKSSGGAKSVTLTILVEAMGHGTSGCFWDWKGMLQLEGGVRLGDEQLKGWKVYPIPLIDVGPKIWPELYKAGGMPVVGDDDIMPQGGLPAANPPPKAVQPPMNASAANSSTSSTANTSTSAVNTTATNASAANASTSAANTTNTTVNTTNTTKTYTTYQLTGRRLQTAALWSEDHAVFGLGGTDGGPAPPVMGVGWIATPDERLLQRGPTFFRGTLEIASGTKEKIGTNAGGYLPCTFFNPRGWSKGIIWVNGFSLGWYWPAAGFQVNLYIPGTIIREGSNDVIILEMEGAASPPTATFVDYTDWSGPKVE